MAGKNSRGKEKKSSRVAMDESRTPTELTQGESYGKNEQEITVSLEWGRERKTRTNRRWQ